MTQDRAKRIMSLLGWGPSEAARQYNRIARARYDRQQVHKQINGERGVSDSFALFLRLSVRILVLERRLSRLAKCGIRAASR